MSEIDGLINSMLEKTRKELDKKDETIKQYREFFAELQFDLNNGQRGLCSYDRVSVYDRLEEIFDILKNDLVLSTDGVFLTKARMMRKKR